MKHFAKLPFVLFFLIVAAFVHSLSASAATPTPRPEPSELVRPQSGNDTFKLASLGIVFLVIGAAVVYAPQIVSAITGLPKRAARSKAKPPKMKKSAPLPKPVAIAEQPTTVIDLPPAQPPPARAPERRVEIPEAHDVVSRLQNEIRSAWSKTR